MNYSFSNDLFDSTSSFTLEEAKGEVDGQNIIGKIAGPFFVPNGKSRNKRFYPESLWVKTLQKKDIQERISQKRMLGTIGHDQTLDDDAVLQGKVSHVITKLEMKDGRGYGEAHILNTPAGKVLKTMAGAGVGMFVSSRATGGYKGEFEGMPVVDENKYQLTGFDFVLDPGFLEANPSLVESLKDSMDQLINIESSTSNSGLEDVMGVDKDLLEQVVRENGSIKNDLDDALKENESLKDKVATANEENESLKIHVKSISEKAEALGHYNNLGTPEEVHEALSTAKDLLGRYKVHGAPEEIGTKIESLEDTVSGYDELGTVEEVGQALDIAHERLIEFKELGTPEEIGTAFTMMREAIESRKSERNESRVEELSKELKIDAGKISKLSESMDDEEIREFFKDVQATNKYGKKYAKSGKIEENNEEVSPKRYFDQPIGKRLMESFGR